MGGSINRILAKILLCPDVGSIGFVLAESPMPDMVDGVSGGERGIVGLGRTEAVAELGDFGGEAAEEGFASGWHDCY